MDKVYVMRLGGKIDTKKDEILKVTNKGIMVESVDWVGVGEPYLTDVKCAHAVRRELKGDELLLFCAKVLKENCTGNGCCKCLFNINIECVLYDEPVDYKLPNPNQDRIDQLKKEIVAKQEELNGLKENT